MACAVSIKMIRSTKTTSTRGTMLISAMVGNTRDRRPCCPPPIENAMALVLEGPFREIQELQRKILHAGAEFADSAVEQVVKNVGGNCRRQAQRRGNERFGDTRRHRAKARAACRCQGRKGVHDAPDGSEQPD